MPAGEHATCVQCGGTFKLVDLIVHESHHVCAHCKPVFLQKLSEGVAVEPRKPASSGFFIPLLTIKFPELDHLPPQQREAILRRCIESPAVQKRQARWSRYPILFALVVGIAIALTTNLVLSWSETPAAIALAFGIFGSYIVIVLLNFFLVSRQVRRLVKQELRNLGG